MPLARGELTLSDYGTYSLGFQVPLTCLPWLAYTLLSASIPVGSQQRYCSPVARSGSLATTGSLVWRFETCMSENRIVVALTCSPACTINTTIHRLEHAHAPIALCDEGRGCLNRSLPEFAAAVREVELNALAAVRLQAQPQKREKSPLLSNF